MYFLKDLLDNNTVQTFRKFDDLVNYASNNGYRIVDNNDKLFGCFIEEYNDILLKDTSLYGFLTKDENDRTSVKYYIFKEPCINK